jgi:hypothetical protein
MADRVFIIPRRNDLAGMNLSLKDLRPNAGQKNNVYDGTHQNVYVAEGADQPGATVVNGLAYVSGSLHTTLVAGVHQIADDRTSVAAGGNNVQATQQTAFGLAAYLYDRVDPGGAAGAGTNPMTVAQANTLAANIMAAADAGNALTLAAINAILTAAPIGAATDLDGAAATSDSFGSVSDILRILAGEVYRLPALTILGDDTGGTSDFFGLAARQAIVAAQLATDVVTYGQFYASGGFLAATDAGYRARPTLVPTGAFNSSVVNGTVAGFAAAAGVVVTNPNFAYNAADVTQWRPRAQTLALGNVAATGLGPAIRAYDQDGNNLA